MPDSSPSATFPSSKDSTLSDTKVILVKAVAKSPAATALSASSIAATTVSKVAASFAFWRKGSGKTKPTDRMSSATSFIWAMVSSKAVVSHAPVDSATVAMGAALTEVLAATATGAARVVDTTEAASTPPEASHAAATGSVSSTSLAKSKSMLDSSPSPTFPSSNELTASDTNVILVETAAKSPAAAPLSASLSAVTTVSNFAESFAFWRNGSGKTKPTARMDLATCFISAMLTVTKVLLHAGAASGVTAAAIIGGATKEAALRWGTGTATTPDAAKTQKRRVDLLNMVKCVDEKKMADEGKIWVRARNEGHQVKKQHLRCASLYAFLLFYTG
ncbi:hypothetical protein C8R43DRAFT_986200 [Mycena crocata]|nr:hypothetical protein C8R43DRAFT_986200 [Mycena crocata]